MNGVIYCYTSPSGKKYIGQTIAEKKRKQQHAKHRGCSPLFHAAIKKYGFENFKYEVLFSGIDNLELLYLLESECIDKYKSQKPNGYNLTSGGDGIPNFERGEDWRRKVSVGWFKKGEPSKGKCFVKGQISPLHSLTKEEKQRWYLAVSKANKRPVSDATRAKMKASRLKAVEKGFINGKPFRSVDQYSLDNIFIKTWPSTTSAAKFYSLPASNIRKNCLGITKKCGGYRWKFNEIKENKWNEQ